MVPSVDFARLSRSPGDYEDMVSVLLSRIRQARRVDGSGGDGGRDCYFTDADGTDAYELKSFTGRMGQTQRRQVERSLRGLFASLCPTCRCVIRWICGVTAGRRAWLCLDSRVSERKRHPGDLSDERWALIDPLITA